MIDDKREAMLDTFHDFVRDTTLHGGWTFEEAWSQWDDRDDTPTIGLEEGIRDAIWHREGGATSGKAELAARWVAWKARTHPTANLAEINQIGERNA